MRRFLLSAVALVALASAAHAQSIIGGLGTVSGGGGASFSQTYGNVGLGSLGSAIIVGGSTSQAAGVGEGGGTSPLSSFGQGGGITTSTSGIGAASVGNGFAAGNTSGTALAGGGGVGFSGIVGGLSISP
jgi:hypothetical protein